MNKILENKLHELENAGDYECWYLVKQPTAFDSICYLVSFLKDFKKQDNPGNLQDYIGQRIVTLKTLKPRVEISNNYRALRVAAFFGLIRMINAKYENASITDTFEEITAKCNGDYEKTELYLDIVQRQIEKMFISSSIDEEYERVRQEYRLYPVMLLYKILIELGRSTGNYSISMTEYRYLVATTKTFEDFLDTLVLIKLLRDDTNATTAFEQYRSKFDNRLIQALKQLTTLVIERDTISLDENHIKEVAHKVYIFEDNPSVFATDNYLGFLGSKKSLFELEEFEEEELANYDRVDRALGGQNVLLYGVPGSGKSWTIEHEYCNEDSIVDRLVFHPDYTNADFIGQILPVVDEDKQVTYEFTPGPFTTILSDAYRNPKQKYILIIEEINRGNAPAVFGEAFQLLDRKITMQDGDDGFPLGTSEYGITHKYMAEFIYGNPVHKVRIPSNLSILGTMNTSDQNVFTLDTAFQRRWRMRLIENNFDNVRRSLADAKILDTEVPWRKFCDTINEIITGNRAKMASAEDKRLGVYFIHENDVLFDKRALPSTGYATLVVEYNELIRHETFGDITADQKIRLSDIREAVMHNRMFPEKVIKYLWDDAFKFNPEALFDTDNLDNLEKVIRTFVYNKGSERFNIFKPSVRSLLYPTSTLSAQSNEE